MDYKRIYDLLMRKRREFPLSKRDGVYCEAHHIVPKCMGGTDEKTNLVNLTAREHFMAHLLLWKHFKGIDCRLASPLLSAVTYMTCRNRYLSGRDFKVNSKLYERIRLQASKRNSKRRFVNDGSHSKLIFKDEPLPDGWREGKISNFSNTLMITDGKENRRISKCETVPDGWRPGNCKAGNLTGMICTTDGNTNRYVNPNDEIEPGFRIGTRSKGCVGRRMITDGTNVRYLKPNESVPDGWRVGGVRGGKYMTDGKTNVMIRETGSIPDGWKPGMTMKINAPRKNSRRIKNVRLKKNRILPPGETLTREMTNEGWEYGMYLTDKCAESSVRRSHVMTLNGVSRTLREWSETTGLNIATLRKRFYCLYANGVRDPERILATANCKLKSTKGRK